MLRRALPWRQVSHRAIATILRHDRKVNSYKIALLRALNDVVLAYPDVRHAGRPIAVPLRLLAEFWIAYYWPFVAPEAEVLQGPRSLRDGRHRNDVGFRPQLRELRSAWEAVHGPSGAAGGWLLVEHLRVSRTRDEYDARFIERYTATLRRIETSLRQPLQYAGEGEWKVFARPVRAGDVVDVVRLPGTSLRERVAFLSPELWNAFRDVSLWLEALAIHEWSLFTEQVAAVGRYLQPPPQAGTAPDLSDARAGRASPRGQLRRLRTRTGAGPRPPSRRRVALRGRPVRTRRHRPGRGRPDREHRLAKRGDHALRLHAAPRAASLAHAPYQVWKFTRKAASSSLQTSRMRLPF
jgi:hypothetical protein